MRRSFSWINLLALLAIVTVPLRLSGEDSKAKKLARGTYLVEQVAICADCHTPRNEKGDLDRKRWLQGAILPFKPTHPVPNWAPASLPIAGLPGWTEADAVKFLETGWDPAGKMANPPMPAYRFSHDDAAAIAAYLKSFKPALQ